MPKHRLRIGLHLELRGREYILEERISSGNLRLKNVSTGEAGPMSEKALLEAYFEGELKFLDAVRDAALVQRKEKGTYYQELSLLEGDDPSVKAIKRDFRRRYKYVIALDEASGKLDEAKVKQVIDTVSKTAGENGGPDPTPLYWKRLRYDWFKSFKASGNDFRVLIPQYAARGNRQPKFTGVQKKGQKYTAGEKRKALEVAETIIEVKNEVLISNERATLKSIADKVELRLSEKNEFRSENNKLPFPDESSVYAFLDRNLDQYEKDKLRYGKKHAEQKYRENKQGLTLSRPLQRVEVDHTLTDLMVIDTEMMLPIGRPQHTSAVDCFTTMGLGFYSSFNYPGWLATMHCLKHAILPKTYVRERYPSVKHDWDCYGIPELIVVDNAPEFHGDAIDEAAIQLGFEIQYGGKGMPWYRATVERHFRTVNDELLHRQPGTTFSNILDKGDYDPVKNALVSFDDFMEMNHIYAIDIYPWESHGGLKVDKFPRRDLKDYEALPGKLWKTWIDKYPPSLPPHRDDLLVLLGELHHRTVSASGIAIDCLSYNCAELAVLRRKKLGGEKFKVKSDPNNLSAVHVEDLRGGYLRVPALNQEYTEGLTHWQHTKIKEYARKKLKKDEELSLGGLIDAKREMQEIVDRCWRRVKKSGTRKLMARFRGVAQEDYGANSQTRENDNVAFAAEAQKQRDATPFCEGASSVERISDLAPAYGSQPDPNVQKKDDDAQPAVGKLKIGEAKDAREAINLQGNLGQKTRASRAKKTQYVEGDAAEAARAVTQDAENDELLDMSQFSGDYDLP